MSWVSCEVGVLNNLVVLVRLFFIVLVSLVSNILWDFRLVMCLILVMVNGWLFM